MLVLSRNEGQRVMIGDDIVLHVDRVRDGKVRLSFDAPKSVEIWREELYVKRQQQKDPDDVSA